MHLVIELLVSLLMPEYPSGSSISYFQNKFYLIGDDANTIMILDDHYGKLDSIRLFDHPGKRIPKAEKVDFETSLVVNIDGSTNLLVLGSGSSENRRKGLIMPLENNHNTDPGYLPKQLDLAEFTSRLTRKIRGSLNIEGSALVGKNLILSNRANKAYPENSLIITTPGFWKDQARASIRILMLDLPRSSGILGISELCYVESHDMLLITLTSEQTNNAIDDGPIGDSYIGWVKNITRKTNRQRLSLDGLLNLSRANENFKGEKIEGLCVSAIKANSFTLHMISDNDQGQTRLFTVLFTPQ